MSGPRWRELADQLERDIRKGDLPAGEQLSSLAEWKKRGHSQTTVLRVYRLLAERGLVETLPGKGTFVIGAAEPDRLSALEARVAELERWRAEKERGE